MIAQTRSGIDQRCPCSNSLLTLLVDFLLLTAFPRVQLSTALSRLLHHKVALPPKNTRRKIEESDLLRSDNLGVISFI